MPSGERRSRPLDSSKWRKWEWPLSPEGNFGRGASSPRLFASLPSLRVQELLHWLRDFSRDTVSPFYYSCSADPSASRIYLSPAVILKCKVLIRREKNRDRMRKDYSDGLMFVYAIKVNRSLCRKVMGCGDRVDLKFRFEERWMKRIKGMRNSARDLLHKFKSFPEWFIDARKPRKLCGYLELNGKELICGLFRRLNLFRSIIVSDGKRGENKLGRPL